MLKGYQERIRRFDSNEGGEGATGRVGRNNVATLQKGLEIIITLGKLTNAPLASAPGREYRPLIFAMLGDH